MTDSLVDAASFAQTLEGTRRLAPIVIGVSIPLTMLVDEIGETLKTRARSGIHLTLVPQNAAMRLLYSRISRLR